MMAVMPPNEAESLTDHGRPRRARRVAWILLSALIVLAVLLAVAVITLSAVRHGASMQSVQTWVSAMRPWMVTAQLAIVGVAWWKWDAIVKRARFAPAVEAVWLAMRTRVLVWGLALVCLGLYLWAIR
jgi:hypothetical protein